MINTNINVYWNMICLDKPRNMMIQLVLSFALCFLNYKCLNDLNDI
jgi:hypothetical protein